VCSTNARHAHLVWLCVVDVAVALMLVATAGQFDEQSTKFCHQLFSHKIKNYCDSVDFVDFTKAPGYCAQGALGDDVDADADTTACDTVYADESEADVRRDAALLASTASAVQHLVHFIEIIADVIDIDRDGIDLCADNWRDLTRPWRV
jgi:hypothetical protein